MRSSQSHSSPETPRSLQPEKEKTQAEEGSAKGSADAAKVTKSSPAQEEDTGSLLGDADGDDLDLHGDD